jgi:hypothetical protein
MNSKRGTKRFRNVENQVEGYLNLQHGDMINVPRPWRANLSWDIISLSVNEGDKCWDGGSKSMSGFVSLPRYAIER